MNRAELENIHESLVNGQRRQMVSQINEYGNYEFWSDYAGYLRELYTESESAYCYFRDATISYFRITKR